MFVLLKPDALADDLGSQAMTIFARSGDAHGRIMVQE